MGADRGGRPGQAPALHARLRSRWNNIKQTSLFHMHHETKATMIEHHGWLVPGSFTSREQEASRVRESAGLADISWTLKFDLKGRGLGQRPEIGPEAAWWDVGRLHALVTCEPAAEISLRQRLEQIATAHADPALPPPLCVTDVSSVYAHLSLAGPRAREVLSKLTSLNLSDESMGHPRSAQASVAHVQAALLRRDLNGVRAYELLVSREYAESVWESVLHAGHEFEIVPFGLDALLMLRASGARVQ